MIRGIRRQGQRSLQQRFFPSGGSQPIQRTIDSKLRLGFALVLSLGVSLVLSLSWHLLLQPQSVLGQAVPVEKSKPAKVVPSQLRVATRSNLPPFVFEQQGQLTGFSIDLWRKIAEKLGTEFIPQTYDTVDQLLQAIAQNQADLGIAAISIT
ncbi:MAG: transporter substrate-binding domain-containing protein, partial [Synechococcales bacterium]|nr:transporter substrate-binding domain-containing protein [Synechococcales bacterium]